MTVTQAQIEAAARAMAELKMHPSRITPDAIEARKKNAAYVLTAAAQVGETFEAGPDECDTGVALTKAIDAVIAEDDAAAQVGEPPSDPITEFERGTIGWATAVTRLQRNATIERCAQVADEYSQHPLARDIAAAIRKLKDEHAPTS